MAVSLSLDGKAALITGGSRGIGAETVRLFCQAGACVAFNYRQARAQAEALAAECALTGKLTGKLAGKSTAPQCIAIEQDLASPADGRALVEKAVQALGRLDILVANHGIWESADVPIDRMTDAQWRRTLSVNLDAVFGLVRAATAHMLKQPAPSGSDSRGHIVLISSTAGQRGEACHADYAVTKGALISLTKSLSSELAARGIRVNCVAPGWVATDMSAAALAGRATGEKILAGIPLGRAATPREIAGPVLFLCTPLAGFIIGEILNVNGGAVLVG
jgi:3-oxoacyl-[acyl-carrier protein] reductase